MENTSKIVDRIQKLLALSTSSNPHEAATAAAKAAKMMADYELEEADLRVESGEANSDPIETTFFDGVEGRRTSTWKGAILLGLVKAFGCHGWYDYSIAGEYPNRVKITKFKVIGRKANVQTANYMYLYLVREITRLCNEAWLAVPASLASVTHGKHWKNSFYIGASSEIYRRLVEQVQEAKKQAQTPGLVLVRKDQEEVDLYFNTNKPRLSKMTMSAPRVNGDAQAQGKEAGSSINLGGAKPSLGAAPRQLTA
jgi:hypothetical protein